MPDRLTKLEAAKIAHSDAVRAEIEAFDLWREAHPDSSKELGALLQTEKAARDRKKAYAAVLALLQEEAK